MIRGGAEYAPIGKLDLAHPAAPLLEYAVDRRPLFLMWIPPEKGSTCGIPTRPGVLGDVPNFDEPLACPYPGVRMEAVPNHQHFSPPLDEWLVSELEPPYAVGHEVDRVGKIKPVPDPVDVGGEIRVDVPPLVLDVPGGGLENRQLLVHLRSHLERLHFRFEALVFLEQERGRLGLRVLHRVPGHLVPAVGHDWIADVEPAPRDVVVALEVTDVGGGRGHPDLLDVHPLLDAGLGLSARCREPELPEDGPPLFLIGAADHLQDLGILCVEFKVGVPVEPRNRAVVAELPLVVRLAIEVDPLRDDERSRALPGDQRRHGDQFAQVD